jgi:glycosyltransferase involved in cell wall biosynthesis
MDYKNKVFLVSPLAPPVGGIATWSAYIIDYFTGSYGSVELSHFNSAMSRNRITDRNRLRHLVCGIRDACYQIFGIIRILKKETPDIVHLTSSASLALFKDYILLRYLQKYNLKTVLHFHFGRIPELKLKNNWEWKMLLKTIKRTSTCIVLDSQSYTTLKKEGFNNIAILPNPITLQTIDSDEKRDIEDIRQDGVVLFVGHVVLEKGVYELVEAVRDINEVKELLFIGPFEENIKNDLVRITGIDQHKIKFMGVKSRDEILYEMRRCNVFVLPSYSEGFPNVILEAMLCACPIVSTSVGAIPEMIGQDRGILVKPKSVNELKINISKLILEKELSVSFGKNASKFVKKNYNIETIATQLNDIWFQNR